MSARKDHSRGSAFPCHGTMGEVVSHGMSLRDYFAAHCPVQFEEALNYNMSGQDDMKFYAKFRFQYADAMILERAE